MKEQGGSARTETHKAMPPHSRTELSLRENQEDEDDDEEVEGGSEVVDGWMYRVRSTREKAVVQSLVSEKASRMSKTALIVKIFFFFFFPPV